MVLPYIGAINRAVLMLQKQMLRFVRSNIKLCLLMFLLNKNILKQMRMILADLSKTSLKFYFNN